MAASINRCIYVYVCVYVGWDRSHTHNDEEHRSGNVSRVNRVDDAGYGLARFHVSHVVPRMTPPIPTYLCWGTWLGIKSLGISIRGLFSHSRLWVAR